MNNMDKLKAKIQTIGLDTNKIGDPTRLCLGLVFTRDELNTLDLYKKLKTLMEDDIDIEIMIS